MDIQTNRNVENSNANANEVELLEYDKQLDLDIDVQGPTINEKFSSVVEKLRLQRISQDQAKASRPGMSYGSEISGNPSCFVRGY